MRCRAVGRVVEIIVVTSAVMSGEKEVDYNVEVRLGFISPLFGCISMAGPHPPHDHAHQDEQ